MKFAVSVFVVVGALLFSQTWEFPSSKNQKLNCNIEENFKEIFNGQKCSNFLNFGKFNNDIYGIEVISETTVKQWKINSKEATDSELNMQDQYVKKVIKHFLNHTDVWVVFQSDTENYLIHWNLASSSNTNLWQLTAESASDFLFLKNTILVIYAKSNEVFATQYKLGKQIGIIEEDKRLITIEHEIQKVQLNNVEIILKDINYDVVKVHFANLFKFFNESGGAENLENKTSSMIPFCIGIFGGCIFGGFIGALIIYKYLKSQYKFINRAEARQQQENARSHERERLNDQRNENDNANANAENTEMDNVNENSKHENKNGSANQKHVATNTVENNSSIDAQNEATNSSNKVENYGMVFNQNIDHSVINEETSDSRPPMLKEVATQTFENDKPKMNLSDIELCVD
uniref:Uncharacterized protein n=1 Tax=Panagrolaimus sp. PS1159 TaxID=55785 RepID=A0AC35F3K2_9BILA